MKEEIEFIDQAKMIEEKMHNALAQVNDPTAKGNKDSVKKRRSDIMFDHDCSQDIDEADDEDASE